MNDNMEYAKWIWEDTSVTVLKALGIYAVALGSYWAFIG